MLSEVDVFFILLILFVSMPVIELALLYQVAQTISLGPTILLVIITGIVGAALAKHEGLKALQSVQNELAQGRMPTTQLFDGVLILVAGVVLITPGIITDAIGFCLLIPPIRAIVKILLTRYFKNRVSFTSNFEMHGSSVSGGFDVRSGSDDQFVDVEVKKVHDANTKRKLQ